MHKPRRLSLLAIVAAFAGAIGCDDSSPGPDEPPTGFERALERVGEGISATGTGFGWIDLGRASRAGQLALALGPGLEDLLRRPARLSSVGIDIADARDATSVAASYAYGVRLDGARADRLARLLRAAGATTDSAGEWTNFDLGEEWEAPLEGPLAPLEDYAARVAIAPDAVILSRVARVREALQDTGASPLEVPMNRLAAECLGDVDSARTLLGSFTHNPFASPELIAVGVRRGDPPHEVLCALGQEPEQARAWERSLVASFAPSASEPLTGEPISRSVAAADVDGFERDGLGAARAELELASGEPPGFLYGALVRGSVLPYVGAPKPIPDGTRLELSEEGERPR